MERLPGSEEGEEVTPFVARVENGPIGGNVDTDFTRLKAGEVVRQVGGFRLVRPGIRDKRYRQGV